ncbi:MAG: DUF72 domain-containing protein [Pedobacter sp.]
MQFLVGCSGFHYKHWRGKFYPEGLAVKNWFAFYCQYFSTLELNVTFYRFPKLETLQDWHKNSPANFVFSVKVPRSITHFKKLNDTSRMLGDFYGLIGEGLQKKLGSVLFQFPPNFSYTEINIQRIMDSVDPTFENVVEFRHKSWWNDEAIARLGQRNIAFCGMSHPDFPDDLIANTTHVYYRLHGREHLYASGYTDNELKNVINRINETPASTKAYLYFNNDIEGYAVENARSTIRIAESH